MQVNYSQVLVGQKAEELEQFDMVSAPDEWKEAIKWLGFNAQEQAVLKRTPVAKIKSNIAAFYDVAIADAKLPYSPTRAKPTIAFDPYTTGCATAYVADRFKWTRAKTQRVLIVAALRARADRLERKTATAPFPLDPFGSGPLRSKGGIAYSVGPDTVDNGGLLVLWPYTAMAKGDILVPTF